MPDLPTAFHDVREVDFPFDIEMIDPATGEIRWSITVPGPGMVQVPGRATLGGPVDVRVRFPDGRWVMSGHDGKESDGHS